MRRRTWLNLFIEPEHAGRLDELAIKKGVSNAYLVAAALARCLSSASTEQHQRACVDPRV
jgi:predicted transcriptional regulator